MFAAAASDGGSTALGEGPSRVLVARELDHPIQAKLAFHLVDRLPGRVGRHPEHVRADSARPSTSIVTEAGVKQDARHQSE